MTRASTSTEPASEPRGRTSRRRTAEPDDNRLRFREAAQPWERIYIAFFVGIFVTAVVAVPVSLYGLEALENNLRLIGAIALTILLTIAFLFGLLFLLRRPLARRLGLPPPGILRDVYDPVVAGLEALRAAKLGEAYLEFKSAAAAGVSFYAWLTIRWWMVSTSIALIGVFATVAGTALLFRHNELLFDQNNLYVDQNRKINEQNRRLRVQNKLLYAQTEVEVRRHFAAQRAELRALQRLGAQLRRQHRQLEARTVRVRWCDRPDASCSDWRSVAWDSDACEVAGPPEDTPCAAVSTQTLREGAHRKSKVPAQDQTYARRALQVLKQIAAGTRIDSSQIEQGLDKCGAELSVGDTLAGEIHRRQELIAVLDAVLRMPDPEVDQSVLDANRLTVGELGRQLVDKQRRVLDVIAEVAGDCEDRVGRGQRRLQEAERQYEALADEVLE